MIPSHACQIWSDADMLHLDTGGSQIELPNTEAGLRRALQIINDREHATNKLNNQVDKLALAAATKAKKSLPKDDF